MAIQLDPDLTAMRLLCLMPDSETLIETYPETIPETVETTHAQKPNAKDAKEQCKILYFQGLKTSLISAETGVKPQTVKTWINRYGWNKMMDGAKEVLIQRGTRFLARESTDQLRNVLREEAESSANLLRKKPAKSVKALANTPDREGRISMLKKLVETVSMIDDWDSDKKNGLILSGSLGSDIDIASSVEPVNDSNATLNVDNTSLTPQQVVDAPVTPAPSPTPGD